MKKQYSFWEVWYISCEGNKRYTTVKADVEDEEFDVMNKMSPFRGGCGDEISELLECEFICISEKYDYGMYDLSTDED